MEKEIIDNDDEIFRAHSKETTKLLYSIIEEAPDGIQIVDLDGRVLFSNKAVERIYGFSPQELKGRHVDEMNVDQSFASKVIFPCINKSGRWQGELKVKHKKGHEFPIWLSASIVKDDKGEPVASIGIIRDISERKKAEETLKQDYEIQCVINSLLSLSLEDISLDAFFEHSLELILSIPGLSIKGKGCIFIIEEDPQVLVMKAQKGFPEAVKKACAQVPFGSCLCGRAALNKEAIFSSDPLDTRHDFHHEDIFPHSHYCLPVLSKDNLLGLINLYLEEGYEHNKRDEALFTAIAYTLAGVIERKRMETVLLHSEARLRAVFENLPFDFFVLGEDGRYIMENSTCRENWGGLVGKRPEDINKDKNLLVKWKDNHRMAFSGKVVKGERDQEINGRKRFFYNILAPVKWGDKVRSILGVNIDITERKMAEEALQKAHDELESQVAKRTAELVEANKLLIEDMVERREMENHIRINNTILKLLSKMPSRKEYLDSIVKLIRGISGCRCVGIRLLDKMGQIPYESYVGFSKAFWESENWLSVNRDQCACIRVIKGKPLSQDSNVMTKGGSFSCNNTIEFFSGLGEEEKSKFRGVCIKNGFASVAIIPISYRNNIIGAIHLADEREDRVGIKIVELIESSTILIGEGIHKFNLNDEIILKQKELDDARRLSDIGALGAIVAHELRNPLAAIQMAAYNINRKAQNPAINKHIANIESKISESNQIINNLLFYSKIRMPNFETINILDILNECIGIAKKLSLKNKVLINKKIEFLKNISIEADPLQMKELFTNILNNSLDSFLQDKGKIEISGELVEPGFIKILINDNGSGIDEADLKKIFEPFFTTKAKGVGLGLTVCSQIVQLHEGAINVASKKSGGSTVAITLPITRKSQIQSKKPFI